MAGHSKWANIKHRKQNADKQRGVLFSKIAKELMVATRIGGSDLQSNTRLRIAVARARACNMSNSTIERSIKKGAGDLDGVEYEEITYEVFAPGGVALIIECLTDKKSRTTPEIKNILSKHNANLAEVNAVSRLFERRGLVIIACDSISEEKLFEIAVEAGAQDVQREGEAFIILSSEKDYASVSEALALAKLPLAEDSGIKLLPIENTQVTVKDQKQADKVLELIEILEEHDDVQAVHSNMDF